MTAFADDPPPMNTWTGKGQIGYLSSQGNTDARSANAAVDMSFATQSWQHSLHVGGLYSQSAGITSGERWDGLFQSNVNITPALYSFGALRYERDLFSGFDFQASASIGVGWKLLATKTTQLSVQAGPGIRAERPQQLVTDDSGHVIARVRGNTERSGILSASLNYSQQLTPTATLADKFLAESGDGNTLYTNQLTLTLKVSTHLAVSLGYAIQDNTAPPAGQKNLDTTETANLVYSF